MSRILVIDDDQQIRELIREILERASHTVFEADNGVAGLQKMAEETVDIVVTDIIMPDKDGLETITELRKSYPEDLAREILAIRNNVPIILCSGYSDAIDEERAKTVGFRDYLKKPTVGNELAAAVRRVLDAE